MAWISINFESKALGMPVMTNVLMPQGRGGYKTLYLLHGAGGDYASWLLKSRVADYAEGNNIAVVMPSGNNKCYVNNRYGKDYFTFLTEELIEKCETWFDLSPKKRRPFHRRNVDGRIRSGPCGVKKTGIIRKSIFLFGTA